MSAASAQLDGSLSLGEHQRIADLDHLARRHRETKLEERLEDAAPERAIRQGHVLLSRDGHGAIGTNGETHVDATVGVRMTLEGTAAELAGSLAHHSTNGVRRQAHVGVGGDPRTHGHLTDERRDGRQLFRTRSWCIDGHGGEGGLDTGMESGKLDGVVLRLDRG